MVLVGRVGERVRRRSSSALLTRANQRLVSVVMTTYRSAAFVRRAVVSLLDQTYRNLEVIVVDDASDDQTVAIVEEVARADKRVHLVRCWRNRGTYWAKNIGMMHARGDYIAFQDSDDWSHPTRIQRQVRAIESRPGAKASTCNYVRLNAAGKTVLNRGLRERVGFPTLLIQRDSALWDVGFFDQVRAAADEEYLYRVRCLLGSGAVVHVPEALYSTLARPDSLSAAEVSLDLSVEPEPLAHLSKDRRAYFEAFTMWHEQTGDLRIGFPARRRAFPAPEAMVPAERPQAQEVTASLASIPRRRRMLQKVVESLLPQVDRLNVFLNHYQDVPLFLDEPRITVARSQDHGDHRDRGKFFFLGQVSGYHFLVDDDIYYPPDYVAYGLAKLRQYDSAVVIGYHGRVLPPTVNRYFDATGGRVIVFWKPLRVDEPVHILGSGTVAYHSSALQLAFRDFATTGMSDVWLAIRAQEQQVPMIAIARPQPFLRPIPGCEEGSLFEEYRNADEQQTSLVRAQEPWTFPDISAAVARRDDQVAVG
jgi:hypothetical protein